QAAGGAPPAGQVQGLVGAGRAVRRLNLGEPAPGLRPVRRHPSRADYPRAPRRRDRQGGGLRTVREPSHPGQGALPDPHRPSPTVTLTKPKGTGLAKPGAFPETITMSSESARGHLTLECPDQVRSQREAILQLAAKYGIRQVRVFGSAARGEAGAGSD